MNIRKILENKKIPLTELAQIMDISRPTLYKLIDSLDEGNSIPAKYMAYFNIIKRPELNSRMTHQRLISFSHNQRQKTKLNKFYMPESNRLLLSKIFERANKDVLSKEFDIDIYRFINLIIAKYKKSESIKDLSKFYLYMYGYETEVNEKLLDFFALIFKTLDIRMNNAEKVESNYYERMYEIADNAKKERLKKTSELKKQVEMELLANYKSKISEEIDKKIELGVDVNSISIKEIIENINIE